MPSIDEILIPSAVANDYFANVPFNSLVGIKRLNVLIGPNNSGKSRLLRSLFLAGNKLQISTDDPDARSVLKGVRSALILSPQLKDPYDRYSEKIRNLLMQHPPSFHNCNGQIMNISLIYQQVLNLRNEFRNRFPEAIEVCSGIMQSLNATVNGLKCLGEKSSPKGQPPSLPTPPFSNPQFVYIPTLRGMRLGFNDENLKFAYFDRTWFDYVKPDLSIPDSDITRIKENHRGEMSGKTIVTGLDFYDILKDRLLGTLKDRNFIRDFESFLSRTFFHNKAVALIPRRDHDTVNIKIGNEKERPIQSLGDGMQQLIILTLPLFEHSDKPLFLFIEEPELFLHPGFQRVLIDTILAERDRQLYVFVATHSSQFLDITLREESCSVFRCSKKESQGKDDEQEPKFDVVNASIGEHELLRHIGQRPSSVMFANCTIWVEGITDRLYYGRFIELVMEQKKLNFIENLHFAFVEYGGGNITHWSFLDEEEGIDVGKVCARLFLISDMDEDKDQRHQILSDALGDRFCRLNVREVENLLTPEVILKVIHEYEGEEVVLNEFSQADYSSEYLGKFIDERVLMDKTKSKRSKKKKTCYEDNTGTVKDKVVFCRKALAHMECVDDLSDEARQIAEKLIEFIRLENHL